MKKRFIHYLPVLGEGRSRPLESYGMDMIP